MWLQSRGHNTWDGLTSLKYGKSVQSFSVVKTTVAQQIRC